MEAEFDKLISEIHYLERIIEGYRRKTDEAAKIIQKKTAEVRYWQRKAGWTPTAH